ncbi:MAG: acyl-CoA thioesterase II [Gammaproteobacteria bacterium]|nr:acyl-CoA thioesterase II [Gammaproteobacteria bacterium]
MNKALRILTEGLSLEKLEENLFRGAVSDTIIKRVYGGKVLGESLTAAQLTVEDRPLHSAHAYFLREADSHSPVIYSVDRSRDGKSFSARRVTAIQHGQPIFTLKASFHKEECGAEYQGPMPEVPPPEAVAPVVWDWSKFDSLSPCYQRMMTITEPFEIRAIDGPNGTNDAQGKPLRRVWIRTTDRLSDSTALHRAILGYISDYGLIWTLLAHHGFLVTNDKVIVASLDHAMWFHRPFRVDEWLLYCCEGVSSYATRGLARGSFYTQAGELAVTVTQEGLMRAI